MCPRYDSGGGPYITAGNGTTCTTISSAPESRAREQAMSKARSDCTEKSVGTRIFVSAGMAHLFAAGRRPGIDKHIEKQPNQDLLPPDQSAAGFDRVDELDDTSVDALRVGAGQ